MVFQREKKQLWRYASSNSPADSDATIGLPQLPPHRRPQHHLQTTICAHHPQKQQQQFQQQGQRQLLNAMSSFADCYTGTSNSSSLAMRNRSLQLNTPPPPYSSVPYGIDCSDCSLTARVATTKVASPSETVYLQQLQQPNQQKRCLTSAMSTETSEDYSKSGCCYGNFGDTMVVDNCEQSNDSNNSSSSSPTAKAPKQLRTNTESHLMSLAPATPILPPPISSFAATAANYFRNCCGAGCLSTESSLGSTSTSLSHYFQGNNISSACHTQVSAETQEKTLMDHSVNCSQTGSRNTHTNKNNNTTINYNSNTVKQQYFSCLMKKLKSRQLTSLLQAVKSFRDAAALGSIGSNQTVGSQHLNCILLKRGLILGEDPYMIVCRLFLWYDLLSPDELKRLPICTNARDPVYICCNPLHWSRILMPEIAPPPYQLLAVERLKNEDQSTPVNAQNEENSMLATMQGHNVSNFNSNNDVKSVNRVQIPESLTTDGEGRGSSTSTIWCEVAYWELSQRVGDRFLAEKAMITIYSEGPRSGNASGGMCLRDLIDKRSTPTPESVKKARQKIGLGVTLCQEADGVWLYNRSIAPVFLHSPTLTECWLHVCKVMPGYCVKAFDNNRAREQFLLGHMGQTYTNGAQTGPIDCFSMRISFAKGWGSKYSRQDITACPCWLEVLFTRR